MEFGNESLWLRLPPKNGKPGNTVKRLSFVLSFDDTDYNVCEYNSDPSINKKPHIEKKHLINLIK